MSEDDPPASIEVLICDDVEALRALLTLVVDLQDGMHVVGEAENGERAVAEAERLQPDVILLDMSMPVRTGLDALPEIKSVAPGAKVIVLSGFASPAVKAGALAQGADRYLEKGLPPAAITAAIAEVASAAPRSLSRR
jgi:DNA-binding NarL/FixJ family response regulator